MSTLVTGEAVQLNVRPASLISRAGAAAIDYLIYMFVYAGIIIGVLWLINATNAVNDLLSGSLVTIIVVIALVLIPTLVETLSHGKSLGKLIFGLRIVRDDGGAITFRHAFIRAMLWQFEVLATGGGVAALTGLLNGRTKRLGDLVAGTLAVAERASRLRLHPVYMPPGMAAWAQHADISPIPPSTFYRVTQFLANADSTSAAARAQRAVELATELNPYVAPAPPAGAPAEHFLAAVVAAVRAADYARLEKEAETAAEFQRRTDALPYDLHISAH